MFYLLFPKTDEELKKINIDMAMTWRVDWKIISVCLLLCVGIACSPKLVDKTAPADQHWNQWSKIQLAVDSLRNDIGAPGMSVAFVDRAGVQTFAAGWSDKENQTLMHADHVLMNGSIGKTYVAAVLFKLIEQGQLDLLDSVKYFMTEYTEYHRLPNAEVLVIDHLLTHTSGLPRYVMDPAVWSFVVDDPDKIWTPVERLAYVLDAEPIHEVGKGWGYSDTNYILLGMIIEKITGKKYEQVVKELILHPLGLAKTFINDRPNLPGLSSAYSGLSQLFQVQEKVALPGKYTFNPQIEWTGGGISTTPTDVAKWTFWLHSGEVLSAESYQKMIEAVTIADQFPDGGKYGRGCILRPGVQQTYYGHSGIMPGFLSITEFSPNGQYAIAIQVNTDRLTPGKNLSAVSDALHELLMEKG